jgi:hypothetical protein
MAHQRTELRQGEIREGISRRGLGLLRQPTTAEYDFVVEPGADPRQIELNFDGAKGLRLGAGGDLIVSIAGGEVIEHKPIIYQDIGGTRRRVAGGYALRNSHTVGFKLAGYDDQRRLTIDPSLVYSTYLGGSSFDEGFGIALDSAGNAYLTGATASSDFPTTAGAFQTTFGGGTASAFVSKLNGPARRWCIPLISAAAVTIWAMELRRTRWTTPTSPASPIPSTFRPRRGRFRPVSAAASFTPLSAS